ncbi:MAG: hypothetical protein VKN33_04820 [Candidatus Sericytochromatia bacterium]|nr:hypothetical protein [Candidatus Sericytochromatia bacterium]
MNFTQAMIVPSLVTMGMGSLLVAQHLSFSEAGYAAPADGKPLAVPQPAGGGVVSAPIPASDADLQRRLAEFPGPGSTIQVVKATPENELSALAVETAGREDPFLMLIPPPAGRIVVPEERAIAPKLPPVTYLPPQSAIPSEGLQGPPPVPALPPSLESFGPKTTAPKGPSAPGNVAALPVVPAAPVAPAAGAKPGAPAAPPRPFGGDKAPPPEQPQWMVRGIVSTGYERICMLEGRAGNNISGRVGDSLADGSVIEAISNRGVTFVRGGRRFVKIIGGIL